MIATRAATGDGGDEGVRRHLDIQPQASSLLFDIAAFPRTVATSSYFLRGLQTREADLIAAMNVADDDIVPQLDSRSTQERAAMEPQLIKSIRDASLEPRERCDFTWRIIRGDRVASLASDIESKGSA